jgi:hypothetical protein
VNLLERVERWEQADTAARWHPQIGWFPAHLNAEAVLELKALGREHD